MRGLLFSSVPLLVLAAVAPAQDERLAPDGLPVTLSESPPFGLPATAPEALPDPSAEARVALGRRLFFDPVLSIDRTVSCASCHVPANGFADSKPLSEGVHGRLTKRNAPTLFNRAYGRSFMWDGQADTLEAQVLLPITNELEMDLPLAEAVARLAEDATYRSTFEEVFDGPPSDERLASSLASFVRRLYLGDSPVDRFRAGEFSALTPAERSGLWFYESRGGCWRCHSGPNFTDEEFHNTGVGAVDGKPRQGRRGVTQRDADAGGFKTPTLRGVELTAPYMHDGSLATLEEVVAFYRQGGHPNTHLDPELGPIDMSDSDAANLVAFLKALSRPHRGGSND